MSESQFNIDNTETIKSELSKLSDAEQNELAIYLNATHLLKRWNKPGWGKIIRVGMLVGLLSGALGLSGGIVIGMKAGLIPGIESFGALFFHCWLAYHSISNILDNHISTLSDQTARTTSHFQSATVIATY